MSVNVSGGALEWEASIDTDKLEASISTVGDKLSNTFKSASKDVDNFSKTLLDSVSSSGNTLKTKPVTEWSEAVQKATQNISELLAKGSASLDPEKLGAFKDQLAGTDQQFQALNQTIAFVKQNLGSLNLNDDDAKTLADSIATIETSFQGFTDKTIRITQEIRNLKNEMATISDKGSPQFIALASQAGALQKEVDESNKSVQLLASTTGGLQAGVGALRGVVGGFEAVAGAVGLASGKSEEMEGVISSIISAMGILNGIQEVADVVNKRSALNQYLLLQYRRLTAAATTEDAIATGALAEAEGAQALATEGATVATAELNTVMGLNPAFVLLTAISALAAGIYFLTQRSHEADEAATRLNKTLLDQYNLSNQIFELSKFSANQNIAAAEAGIELSKAQNLSQKTILDQQIKLDKLKQDQAEKDVKKAQDDLTGAASIAKLQEDAYAKIHKLSANAKPLDLGFVNTTDIPTLTKNLDALEQKLIKLKNAKDADKNKTQIDLLSSQIDLLKPKITNYIQSLTSLNSASFKTTTDSVQQVSKAYDDDVKSFTSAQEAKTLALGRSANDQLTLTLDSIRAQTAAQLDPKLNPNLTQGEITKIKAQSLKQQADAVFASNQKEYADTTKLLNSEAQLYKEGTQQRLTLELKAIEITKQAQLQQFIDLNGQAIRYRQLSADQQASIVNEINKQVADKQKAFAKQAADDALEIQISSTKAQLSVVEDGSADQLQLKKDLLDQEAALEITNATFTINNQELLAAKIKEINAGVVKAKKEEDDKYANSQIENTLKIIQEFADRQKEINILTSGNTAQVKTDNIEIDTEAIKHKIAAVNTAILEVIKTGNGDIDALLKKRHSLMKELNDIDDKTKDSSTDNSINKFLNQAGNSIGTLGNNLKQYNEGLGEVFSSLGNIAKNAVLIGEIFKKLPIGATDAEKAAQNAKDAAGAIEATVQIISLLVSSAAQRAQAESQFNADLLSQQEAYNLALNENILLNNKLKDNVFVTNFQGELTDSIAALTDAQKKYQDSLRALSAGQAKAGQANQANVGSILSGAASGAVLGAEIGTIIPGIGNVVGTVVGGIAGAIAGFFGGKKKVDTYVSLLQAYPTLLEKTADGVLHINEGLAKSLLSNNQLSDSTKVLVQDTLDWQDAIDKANQQFTDIISQLAGGLGSDLSDSLVKAFEDGTDAGQAFAKSVGKTLETVLQQLLFNQVFGDAFTSLQDKMKASFQTGGDFNWQDDLESFFQQYSGLSQTFDDALKTAQTEAQKAGLSIFQTTADSQTGGANSLSGAIKGITEQQADLLAGQFGGLRITAIDQLTVAKQSFSTLQNIEFNTAMLLDVKNTLNYFKLNGIHVV